MVFKSAPKSRIDSNPEFESDAKRKREGALVHYHLHRYQNVGFERRLVDYCSMNKKIKKSGLSVLFMFRIPSLKC